MRHRPHKPWYRRVLFWVPVSLVVVLVAVYLLLDPIATWATRRGLASMKGFQGDFEDVGISLVPLRYSISKLKIVEEPVKKGKAPIFYARYIEAGAEWKELLRGRISGVARLEKFKSTILLQEGKTPKDVLAEKAKKAIPPPYRIDEALKKIIPFRIDRVEVIDSEVLVIDTKSKGDPEIWLHDIEATVENFATRDKLHGGKPTTVALRAVLQGSGKLSAYITADPLAEKLTFAGQARLAHMKIGDLHKWIVAKQDDIAVPKGEFEAFVTFECKQNQLTGGIKPILKNVDVQAQKKDLGARLKEALADASLDILSDDVPGREAVATVIPIKGNIQRPNAQIWPTIIATIRNAFVEGLAANFSNTPPPTAPEKEGVIQQARRGLSKESRPPVKAQPRR